MIDRALLPSEQLALAVRDALADEKYTSAAQILERLPMREALIQQCGSREQAVRHVKEVLLKHLSGQLAFDFTPNGRSRDVMGSAVPEVSMVFRLRK